jgi:hypothetical protein
MRRLHGVQVYLKEFGRFLSYERFDEKGEKVKFTFFGGAGGPAFL